MRKAMHGLVGAIGIAAGITAGAGLRERRANTLITAGLIMGMLVVGVTQAWGQTAQVRESVASVLNANPEGDFEFSNGTITNYVGPGGDVVIPATIGGVAVTTIGMTAFNTAPHREEITSVALPASVTSLADYAFSGCRAMTAFTFAPGSGLRTIGQGVFMSCALTSIILPSGLTSIGQYAFSSCSNLTEIFSLNPTPPTLGSDVFTGVSHSGCAIFVPEGSVAAYQAANGWSAFTIITTIDFVFDGNGKITGYFGPGGAVAVPDSLGGRPVTSIGEAVFANRADITGVSISASVTTIGWAAFDNCAALRSVTFAPSSRLTSIEGMAFADCHALAAINLPAGLKRIDIEAFYACFALTDISLPDGLTYIGTAAFTDCQTLAGLTIPASTDTVGWAQFWGCTKLTEIRILNPTPPAIKREQPEVFNEADMFLGLPEGCALIVPNGSKAAYLAADVWGTFGNIITYVDWTTAPASDFTAQNGVIMQYVGAGGNVVIPESIGGQPITGIAPQAFGVWAEGSDAANTTLTAVRIPAGVTSIDNYAFAECPNLTHVAFADSSRLQRIERNAFINCALLETLALPDSLQSIGNMAFFGCTSLQTVTLGVATASVGDMAFYGCPALTTLNSRSLTPPALGMNVFGGYGAVGGGLSFANASLYVPETSAAAYQAANTWKNFANLTADIPVGHDTIWQITHKDTTVVDTTHKDSTVYNITRKDTTIYTDTIHKDSIAYDTIIHKDSIIYDDTIHKDSIAYDTIIHKDSIHYDTIIHKDSVHIVHRDSIIYDDTIHEDSIIIYDDTIWKDTTIYRDSIVYIYEPRDTVVYRDSIVWQIKDSIVDTLYLTDTIYTDTLYDVAVFDTLHFFDTVRHVVTIIDSTLAPETLWRHDTITDIREVTVETPVYIVINTETGVRTTVDIEARVTDYGADGIIVENLTAGMPLSIYTLEGALAYRGMPERVANFGQPCSVQITLPYGTYLLWHNGRWTKFTHR